MLSSESAPSLEFEQPELSLHRAAFKAVLKKLVMPRTVAAQPSIRQFNELLSQAPDTRLHNLKLLANYIGGSGMLFCSRPFAVVEADEDLYLSWGRMDTRRESPFDVLRLLCIPKNGRIGMDDDYLAHCKVTDALIPFRIERLEGPTPNYKIHSLTPEQEVELFAHLVLAPQAYEQWATEEAARDQAVAKTVQ